MLGASAPGRVPGGTEGGGGGGAAHARDARGRGGQAVFAYAGSAGARAVRAGGPLPAGNHRARRDRRPLRPLRGDRAGGGAGGALRGRGAHADAHRRVHRGGAGHAALRRGRRSGDSAAERAPFRAAPVRGGGTGRGVCPAVVHGVGPVLHPGRELSGGAGTPPGREGAAGGQAGLLRRAALAGARGGAGAGAGRFRAVRRGARRASQLGRGDAHGGCAGGGCVGAVGAQDAARAQRRGMAACGAGRGRGAPAGDAARGAD